MDVFLLIDSRDIVQMVNGFWERSDMQRDLVESGRIFERIWRKYPINLFLYRAYVVDQDKKRMDEPWIIKWPAHRNSLKWFLSVHQRLEKNSRARWAKQIKKLNQKSMLVSLIDPYSQTSIPFQYFSNETHGYSYFSYFAALSKVVTLI